MPETAETSPYEGLSDSDVQAQATAAQVELERRAALPEQERLARLIAECEEVDRGERVPGIEHIRASKPETTARWLAEGRLAPLGYGGKRRRR